MTVNQGSRGINPALVASLAVAILCGIGCARGFFVEVRNELETPAVLELSQYHAADFGKTRPEAFTEELLAREPFRVSVQPGEKAEIELDDSRQGYWLAFRQVEPYAKNPVSGTYELKPGSYVIIALR